MASPSDLVTVAQVQAYIDGAAGVSTTKLGGLITAVSMAILGWTNRTSFLPKTYTEIRDGSPRGIILRNWPVQSVQSITISDPCFGGTTAFAPSVNGSVGYILDTMDDAPAGSPQMIRAPYGGLHKGIDNVTITYTAGYQINGESAKVPAGGGTVTAAQPYGTWGSDAGVAYLSGTPLTAVAAGSEALGKYSVSAGVYTFSAADTLAFISISYGYIPADLANACLEWIADRLAYQDRIGLASKSLGGQETVSFRIAAVPDFVKGMLATYANVVPVA